MIPTRDDRRPAPLPPRWRFGGLVKDWLPACDAPSALGGDVLVPGTPRTHPAESLVLDAPESVPVEGCVPGQAVRYEVGWYDLSGFREPAPLWRSASEEPAETERLPRPAINDTVLRLAAVLQPPLARLIAPNGVLEWPAPLLKYQREGIAALLKRNEILLADDMGLGKTVQAIAALRILTFQHKIESALVVCPASLLAQWRRELARWAPELKVVTLHGRTG